MDKTLKFVIVVSCSVKLFLHQFFIKDRCCDSWCDLLTTVPAIYVCMWKHASFQQQNLL